jgi:hypothetical protein
MAASVTPSVTPSVKHSNIQFSYPIMNGTLTNGDFTITDDGGGYFQCNYHTTGDIYKLFKPTKLQFFNGHITITHKYNNDTLYVKFPTSQDGKRELITATNIYLNKLIGDGIENDNQISFTNKTCDLSNNTTNYYIDMTPIGSIPLNNTTNSSSEDPFSSTIPISGLTKVNTFELTPSSFITDEIVCDEGTSSTDSSVTGTTATGQIKPLSNSQAKYTYYGVAVIMGYLLVQYGILVAFKNGLGPIGGALKYPAATKLFSFFPEGFESKAVFYCISTVAAFIMSFVFFVLYGIFGPSTKNPSSEYWYYLALAIFYLLAFISYLWWKVTYLTGV